MDTKKNEPEVYKAVRAIGTLKPKFQPNQGKIFVDKLDIKGTAFWLKDYQILITCAHVVQDIALSPVEIAGLLVVGNLGNYQPALVSVIDFTHDLAVIHLPLDTPKEILEKEASNGLEIVDDYPEVGDEISYAGFPLGLQLLDMQHSPTYAEGVIGAKKREDGLKKQIQITGAVTGGFSGSPIVLKSNKRKLIGVLSNTPSKEAGDANIFMAISWEHVKSLAEMFKK